MGILNKMESQKPELGIMSQLSTKNVLDDLDFIIKNNFQWFEIGLDWKQNFNLSDKILKQLKNKAKENNIKLIVHTPWYLPCGSIIPEIHEAVMKILKKGVIVAKKVGSNRVTVHPGIREMPGPAIDLNYDALKSTLKELVEFANKDNINICFENYDASPNYLSYNVEDYLKVLNSVKGLKTTLDLGHANTTTTNPIEYLTSIKHTIMNIHVHDNDGKHDEHKLLGQGNIDFIKLFKKCKEIGYKGPFTFELFPYENLLKGKEKFLELWEKAK